MEMLFPKTGATALCPTEDVHAKVIVFKERLEGFDFCRKHCNLALVRLGILHELIKLCPLFGQKLAHIVLVFA